VNAFESLSTLQWAKRAQAIINVSVQGIDSADVQAAMERIPTPLHIPLHPLASPDIP